jgi:DNA polymerase III subunit gamma/tau
VAPRRKPTAEIAAASPPEGGAEAASDTSPAAADRGRYVVLARRYRPGQFEEVVGQEHVTRTLQNAIAATRVHHAYLFTGSRGVGKTTVARILAKALNCDEGATSHPCDRCASCTEIRNGSSVDVFEIDGASHTGVDDVRELRESVRYQPARCRHKIYIIDEVHMLSTSAFNALLKTLEEPPPHVIFIFATTEPHKIPATILSRCQRFDFKRVADPVLVKHLTSLCEREQITIDRGGLGLIARASEGSVRDSLSLLDQVIAYAAGNEISTARVAEVLGVADRRMLFVLSRAILGRDPQAALGVIDQLFDGGQDLVQFAQAFVGHLRDLTVVRTCGNPGPLLDATEAEQQELGALAGGAGADVLPQLFDRFARTAEEISRSSFPRLLLEMAVIEMVHAEPLLPLGDLIERLERLEARLGSSGGSGPAGAPRFPSGAPPRPPARPPGARTADAEPKRAFVAPGPPPAAVANSTPSESGSAVAGSPVGNGHSLESWQRLLKQAEVLQPVAASAFVSGRLLSWKGDTILLGYPPDSFELQRAQDREKREAFEQACSQQAGRRLTIQVRHLRPEEAASPEVQQMSAAQDRERHRAERAEQLRDEARGHPITRALIEKCGAQIQSITTTEAEEP